MIPLHPAYQTSSWYGRNTTQRQALFAPLSHTTTRPPPTSSSSHNLRCSHVAGTPIASSRLRINIDIRSLHLPNLVSHTCQSPARPSARPPSDLRIANMLDFIRRRSSPSDAYTRCCLRPCAMGVCRNPDHQGHCMCLVGDEDQWMDVAKTCIADFLLRMDDRGGHVRWTF
jgi:hypothetical protein